MLIGVVAHAKREVLASKLSGAVQPDAVSFDRTWPPSAQGCADNHIRVLKSLNGIVRHGQWCVVLEDDAVPVDDFRQELHRALLRTDASLVGLYLGTGNPDGPTQRAIMPAVAAAEASESAWIVADWFISTVGYAVRSTWLADLITGISMMGGPVDNRISQWSQDAGLNTWYCQPSLVDHHDESSMLSTFTPHPRHAHRFGVRDQWNSLTVPMGYAEGWSPE